MRRISYTARRTSTSSGKADMIRDFARRISRSIGGARTQCARRAKRVRVGPQARTYTAKQVIKIKFSMTDCQVCTFRQDCTKSRVTRRTLTISPEDQFEMRRVAREREQTWEYQKQYWRRSGIENTMKQTENESKCTVAEAERWARGLDLIAERISTRFPRSEPRERATAYLRGYLNA